MTGSMKMLQTRCERAKWTEAIDLSGVVTSEDDHQVLVISTSGAAPRGRSRPMKCNDRWHHGPLEDPAPVLLAVRRGARPPGRR